MINYPRTHKIIAAVIFFIALGVYVLTLSPTVSFWDCGEFISGAYRLQVVHPPGAPLYQIIGRIFSLFTFGNPQNVAFWVNMLSAVSSAFCVLLTYLITTRLATKIVNPMGLPLAFHQHLSIWGAGAVAALTLAFTDTFWFSAVEAEVYSLSSLFTLLVFWASLKWEENKNSPLHIRWLLFMAFAVGLSIGVHLLNLLVIPAVVFVVYFGLKPYSFWGAVKASAIGIALLLTIQFIIIPYIPALAAYTDLYAVNHWAWNIGTGAWFSLALLGGLIALVLFFSHQKNWFKIHLAVLCLAFVLIGYSSYTLVPIRAAANPPININAPDNAFSFLSYLNREQYGGRALVHGPAFNAPIDSFLQGKAIWRPNENGQYEVVGHETDYRFNKNYMLWFPRIGDVFSGDSQDGYVGWTKLDPNAEPSQAKNLEFFFKYQMLHMYVRYHLWNFAGRQNDVQGHGNAMDGNGVTGFSFIDENIAAPLNGQPKARANNKAANNYYLLPLLLGFAGMFFQAKKDKTSFVALLVLFLFTGFFLCLYLNVPPFEPRERDYVFVGSFQVFSIWVGLGALWLMRFMHTKIAKGIWLGLIVSLCISPLLLISQNWDDHNRSDNYFARDYAANLLQGLAPNSILFVYGDNDTYPLWYLQNVEGLRTDVRVLNANLLGSDWGAFGLQQQQYNSPPIQLSISPHKYQQSKRLLVSIVPPTPNEKPEMHFADALAYIAQDSNNTETLSSGNLRCTLPARSLFLLFETDSSTTGIIYSFDLNSRFLTRADVLLMDILANNPDRPIYFSSRSKKMPLPQLQSWLDYEGLVYRLGNSSSPDWTETSGLTSYNLAPLIKQWQLRGFSSTKNYIDPEAKKIAQHYMDVSAHTIKAYQQELNHEKAGELALLCVDAFELNNFDFNSYAAPLTFVNALYANGQTEKANAYVQQLTQRLMDETTYYQSLKNTIADYSARKEIKISLKGLRQLKDLLNSQQQTQKAQEIEKFLAFFAPKTHTP